MAQLSNANSLFELAFAVNGGAALLFERNKILRQQIVARVIAKINALDPEFAVVGNNRDAFSAYVESLVYPPDLPLFRLTLILQCFAYLVTAFAISGLLWAAVEPNQPIDGPLLIAYAVASLIVLPTLYVGHQRLLELAANAIPDEHLFSDVHALLHGECFKLIVASKHPRANFRKLRAACKGFLPHEQIAKTRAIVRFCSQLDVKLQ